MTAKLVLAIALSALVAFSVCAAEEGKKEEKTTEKKADKKHEKKKQEEKVALDKLPEAVKAAAERAVKGIVLTEAEKETKGDEVVYEVEGKAGGKLYEIKIAPDGKVIKVEEEKEDDKDDDKDDEDDKDDKDDDGKD